MNPRKAIFGLLILIIFSTVIYGAVNISKTIANRSQKKEIINSNKSDIKKLKIEIAELNDQLKKTNSSEFIEKVAREDLKMVKPREVVYIDSNKEYHREDGFDDFR